MLKPWRGKQGAIETDAAKLLQLLQRIQFGDQSALGDFYDATVARVYARILRITGNTADAEEATFDVYHQMWRTANKYDRERGNPYQWVLVMARSRAIDYCRARQAMLKAYLANDCDRSETTAEQLVYNIEVASLVRTELAKLGAQQARIIGLAFFDGLSHSEIAKYLQLPLGSVKSHICRGLSVLRKTLATIAPLRSDTAQVADTAQCPELPARQIALAGPTDAVPRQRLASAEP